MKRICSLGLCLVMIITTVLGVNILAVAADNENVEPLYIEQNLGWQPGDTEWQQDFYCEVDGDNLILCWYQGDAKDVLNIPDEAVVDGKVLKTKLENDCGGLLGTGRRASFKEINFGEHIDTSNVTSMASLFSNCSSLENLDISCFDTSNVLKMNGMFSGCKSLKSVDLSGLDTSKVSGMGDMFENCNELTDINMSGWDTSKVTSMHSMFKNCNSLQELDLNSFDTSNVTLFECMFSGCTNLTSLKIDSWNTSNARSTNSMFDDCSSLSDLSISNWNTKNLEDMAAMFRNCKELKKLDLNNWNTSNVTVMSSLFNGCSGLSDLRISNFDMSRTGSAMQKMFLNCSSLTELDLSKCNVTYAVDMESMFEGCSSLKSLDVHTWNTSHANKVKRMFYGCGSLSNLDLSGWNLSSISYHDDMLTGCYSLKTINVPTRIGSYINLPYTFVKQDEPDVEYVYLPRYADSSFTIVTPDQIIPVTGITITPKTQSVDVGSSFFVTATITPADSSSKKVTWSSSDTSVATVDENGEVTGVGEGTATITGKTVDGGYSDSCIVTVNKEGEEKQDPTVTPPKAKTNLTYTGKPLELVEPGQTNGGTLQYGLGTAIFEPKSWSTSVPTATEVGTYYIWYKIVGDEYYNDTPPAYIGTASKIADGGDTPESDNVVSVDEMAGTAVVKNEYTGGNDTVDLDIIEQSDIYRMYNPITAEHLYTKDAGELEYLLAIGWNHESESDYTVIDARDSDAIPVYRLFNPYTDTHHYTESVDEVKYDVSLGWVYERISHYVYHKSSDKGTPQWRLYTSSGPHNWTSDTGEISWLESMGWINEGIRWRVL